MGYSVEYRNGRLEMANFLQKYQDREKFLAFCKECPHYNSLWSCPPLTFDPNKYLAPYTWINLLCAKINLDNETIREAGTKDKVKTMGRNIVFAVKRDTDGRLRQLEAKIPGSRSISSGGCNLCENCSRISGIPCRKPNEMRYSLDSFGLDLTAITKDVFQIEILWSKDSLPQYFTLIHAFLTKEPLPQALFESVGLT
ncbi:MAG: DUF2284 domain-containing protein [bacterium]|nr:DUF2284 domain-containing protein [bacterium]